MTLQSSPASTPAIGQLSPPEAKLVRSGDLQRQTLTTSREMEYFTERELSMQLGASREDWPVMLAKELCDNGLDACEAAGTRPEITITVAPDYFQVTDNGPGLPEKVLRDSLNYLVRVSDKAHYVSPSRGQLGNALKCVWAAPFVADSKSGVVEVTTHGMTHIVKVEVDQIAQRPAITVTTAPRPDVKTGTIVKIHWPDLARCTDDEESLGFYNLADELVAFNPHASIRIVTGEVTASEPPTDPDWQKWLPSWPTSPHWYSANALSNLIGAYVSNGSREKSVREFVSEFAGLTGSAKQKRVTEASGLGGLWLADLVTANAIDPEKCSRLLTAMRAESYNSTTPPGAGTVTSSKRPRILEVVIASKTSC
jgi:DNA topoisomerase VI subunit B